MEGVACQHEGLENALEPGGFRQSFVGKAGIFEDPLAEGVIGLRGVDGEIPLEGQNTGIFWQKPRQVRGQEPGVADHLPVPQHLPGGLPAPAEPGHFQHRIRGDVQVDGIPDCLIFQLADAPEHAG